MTDKVLTQCTIGGPVKVTVRDGKIIKMRPFVLDETDGGRWTIEARGRTFTDPRKIPLGSFVSSE
jgi:hypothetical protein